MIFENFFWRFRVLKPDWLLQNYFVRFTLYLVKLHILFKLACHYSSYEKKIHFTRDKNPVLEVNYHLQPLKTYRNSRYVRKLGYVLNGQILNLQILKKSSFRVTKSDVARILVLRNGTVTCINNCNKRLEASRAFCGQGNNVLEWIEHYLPTTYL